MSLLNTIQRLRELIAGTRETEAAAAEAAIGQARTRLTEAQRLKDEARKLIPLPQTYFPLAPDDPALQQSENDIKERTVETLARLEAADTLARARLRTGIIAAVAVIAALVLILVVPGQVRKAAEARATATARARLVAQAMARDVPPAAFDGVTHNADWTAVMREFGGVRMALVPAGCFMMGSQGGDSDEQPAHRVCFAAPFWLDVTEVTNAQFERLGGVAGRSSGWKEPQRPRGNVTWAEANAFCQQRSMRLPSEAEWEYAARGPDGLAYPWGNTFVASNAIYSSSSVGRTWDVGSRLGGVSWVGALDMSGNVWEWANDWYDADYYSTSPAQDPTGPATGEVRVLRGGSWYDDDKALRAANRIGYTFAMFVTVGIRCARPY